MRQQDSSWEGINIDLTAADSTVQIVRSDLSLASTSRMSKTRARWWPCQATWQATVRSSDRRPATVGITEPRMPWRCYAWVDWWLYGRPAAGRHCVGKQVFVRDEELNFGTVAMYIALIVSQWHPGAFAG